MRIALLSLVLIGCGGAEFNAGLFDAIYEPDGGNNETGQADANAPSDAQLNTVVDSSSSGVTKDSEAPHVDAGKVDADSDNPDSGNVPDGQVALCCFLYGCVSSSYIPCSGQGFACTNGSQCNTSGCGLGNQCMVSNCPGQVVECKQ